MEINTPDSREGFFPQVPGPFPSVKHIFMKWSAFNSCYKSFSLQIKRNIFNHKPNYNTFSKAATTFSFHSKSTSIKEVQLRNTTSRPKFIVLDWCLSRPPWPALPDRESGSYWPLLGNHWGNTQTIVFSGSQGWFDAEAQVPLISGYCLSVPLASPGALHHIQLSILVTRLWSLKKAFFQDYSSFFHTSWTFFCRQHCLGPLFSSQ